MEEGGFQFWGGRVRFSYSWFEIVFRFLLLKDGVSRIEFRDHPPPILILQLELLNVALQFSFRVLTPFNWNGTPSICIFGTFYVKLCTGIWQLALLLLEEVKSKMFDTLFSFGITAKEWSRDSWLSCEIFTLPLDDLCRLKNILYCYFQFFKNMIWENCL